MISRERKINESTTFFLEMSQDLKRKRCEHESKLETIKNEIQIIHTCENCKISFVIRQGKRLNF